MGIESSYRFVDHTADLGIVVRARDIKGLFRNAALAVFDIIADSKGPGLEEKRMISVEGEDLEDLMINWLREILYLWNGKEYLVQDVAVVELSKEKLSAEVVVEAYEPKVHAIKTEIKAVTYHQARVGPADGGWEAQVIFDT